MSASLYSYSIPLFVRQLHILQKILKKAAANADERKIDPSVFITARLAPDMFALARQVQIATDMVKGFAARAAGVEVPSYADTETSFAELDARIAKTIAFLNSFSADQISSGDDARIITLKIAGQDHSMTALDYLQSFVTPNFYFHIMIVYAILRNQGVPLGKMDFLGTLNLQ